tara:strand:- start:55 stop:552 length:498 start_codon:yes stop_codon:yes gene_type:complete
MKEEEVYLGTKNWFKKNGFIPIAGQPPNGSDSIPKIEIKDSFFREKGSKGSFTPDLLCISKSYFFIIECKPKHSGKDKEKLIEIINSSNRRKLLYKDLLERKIFQKRNLVENFLSLDQFNKKIRYVLSHNGDPKLMKNIITLTIQSRLGEGIIHQPINKNFSIFI